jgi:hypothetical protein
MVAAMPSHRIEERCFNNGPVSARRIGLASLMVACSTLVGCDLPRDPEGTLDRVRNGVLRVGVTPHGEWVESDAGRPPTGIEPALVEDFARQHGATIQWFRGSETEVLTALEEYELDLVVGGLTEDTLWSDRIALSQPYFETENARHVIAVAPGENAFLLELDRFLKRHEGSITQRVIDARSESSLGP